MHDHAIHTENTDPEEQRRREPPAGIQGWGADLDPANRPAVPMERTPPRLADLPYSQPSHQRRSVEVLHSTERPGLTPVFGTTLPPKGLSGVLRRKAFRYSENDLRHWMMLMAADRIDVGEGLIEDLAHGHVPNIYAEMGGPAEWRYNRTGFIRKAMVAGAVVGLAVYLMRRKRA